MWAQVKVAEQQEAQITNQMQGVNQSNQRSGGGRGRGLLNLEKAKKKFPCLKCGKLGHWRNECKAVLNTNTGNQNSTPQVQNEVSFQQPRQQQIVAQQSGATATYSPECQ